MITILVTPETYLVALEIDAERWEGAEELSVVSMEYIIRGRFRHRFELSKLMTMKIIGTTNKVKIFCLICEQKFWWPKTNLQPQYCPHAVKSSVTL